VRGASELIYEHRAGSEPGGSHEGELCKLNHEVWRTELRMVESVSDPDAAEYRFATFVIEDGQPGAQGECVPVDPPPLGRVDC
jgi:hypothetical protein